MTPRLRRLLWIAGSFVAGLIALALVIPLFVDINRYHDTLEAKAEGLLRRDVTLGTMKLTLFPIPGVSVKPLAIASDRKGDPPLFKAESLSAHVRILPLLGGEIAVASLIAHHPELNLHRYPDGHTNLPDLSAAGSAPAAQQPASAPSEGGLSLAKLRIEGARLRLVDEMVLPGKTVTTTLDPVDVALDDYAPGRPFAVKFETALPPKGSGFMSLSGTVALPPALPGPAPGQTNVELQLKKFQPSAFTPYFQSLLGFAPPMGSASGKLQTKARLKTSSKGTWELEGDGSLQGDLELRGIALRPAGGGSPARAGDLDLALDVAMTQGGKHLDIRNLTAGSGKTRLAADGSLDLLEQGGRLDVKVRPSQVMASDLATVAALLGAKFPAGFSSAAPIAFQGGASGPLDHPEQMKFHGEITLSGVRYADPSLGKPIEDVSGKLTFESGGFKVSGFAARVGKTKLNGGLTVQDFASPRVALNLHSPSASLDELMSLLTPTSSGTSAQSASAPTDDILARTRGTGVVRIDEGSYGTFRFSRFEGNLRLADKVVTFDPVSFRLYGGTYQGTLSADLRGAQPRYGYRSSLKGVDAQPFLAENLGIKDLLAGSVSADVEMEGGGSEMNSILNSLKGHGTLKVEKGWIGQLNVMEGLAKASNLLGERTLTQVSSNLAKKRTEFSSLTGDIDLAGGRATSNNLRLVSKDLDLQGRGGFTLQGMLNLDLKVLFSKDLTQAMLQEGSRARYLEQDGGRIVLPLTIKGPLASPTYGVNIGDITRAAAKSEAVQRLAGSKGTLGQLASTLLGGGKNAPPPQAPGAPAGTEESKKITEAAPPRAAASTDGAILISSTKYEGGFLMPDLTLRGEFNGVGLTGADIKVVGQGDRTVWEKANAFKEIAAYYTTHDPKAPARVPFKMKIDGKKLAGAGDLKITLTLRRSDGTTSVQTINEKKPGL
jgi:uncharacterized protein involved in outer membrane biogenesis